MPIVQKSKVIVLEGKCPVDEAEPLLTWLQEHPKGKVNLSKCKHLHAALLQVLMAVKPKISSMPRDETLYAWMQSALNVTENSEYAAKK
ncbi:MAG: hypothetical protein Q9M33_13155 [Robiginitomaculum sp.]|nr:hypothetical protein [Robiginitomaculum sp.]